MWQRHEDVVSIIRTAQLWITAYSLWYCPFQSSISHSERVSLHSLIHVSLDQQHDSQHRLSTHLAASAHCLVIFRSLYALAGIPKTKVSRIDWGMIDAHWAFLIKFNGIIGNQIRFWLLIDVSQRKNCTAPHWTITIIRKMSSIIEFSTLTYGKFKLPNAFSGFLRLGRYT